MFIGKLYHFYMLKSDVEPESMAAINLIGCLMTDKDFKMGQTGLNMITLIMTGI